MTPRAAAVLGLRLIALWILIQALLGLVVFVALMLSGHPAAAHVTNPIIAPSFDRTQVTSLTHAFPWSTFFPIVMRIIGGMVLLFLSKPIGNLVSRGVE
jgi:uncharacterized membrane protein